MIKLIIFDLDGVLVDARELHYLAMNEALSEIDPKYIISRDEHLARYDGLSTTKKLKMLTEEKGLDPGFYGKVWKLKQLKTREIIASDITEDLRLKNVIKTLKQDGYTIAVASNSIRETVKMMLLKKGFLEHIDYYYSNQDVVHPKPNPEMYYKCMIKAAVSSKETLIVEDSHIGRKAALSSGAYLCPVMDSGDVTLEKLYSYLEMHNSKESLRPKWQGDKMKVLIPMAGAGSRFQAAGYTFPKPLIEVKGKPMIQLVIENLNIDAQHIFVVQKQHYEDYNLNYLLNLISPNCEIVQVDQMTEGAACTALLAKDFINDDEPLLFANSDQFLEWDSNEFMYSMMADGVDGGILTFTATHPKWSFAKLDTEGYVTQVAEKKPISDIATCGVYFWRKGSDFVKYAEQMIQNDVRVNNEFYVCPVFNEAVQDEKKIKTFHIDKMWGLGTPEDLKTFIDRKKV
tara:strand:+ start:10241 stop:11614 length:1374 start_codon:yes stop_codon:yes gene_type:complete